MVVYIPFFIFFDAEEETKESTLWKVKREDRDSLEKNILNYLLECGYKKPRFNGLELKYKRSYPFSFSAWFVLWFVVAFGLLLSRTMRGYSLDFLMTLAESLIVSALLTTVYCFVWDKLSIKWLDFAETKEHYLIEMFGSKIERATFAEDVGLKRGP